MKRVTTRFTTLFWGRKMPKRTPKYCLHKPTGQARVRIHDKDFYLGEYDSEESHRRYDELVGLRLA